MTKSTPYIQSLLKQPLNFLQLIDEIPLGVVVMDCDQRVVFLNKTFEAMTGNQLERACGVECYHVLRGAACVNNCPIKIMGNDDRTISCRSDLITLDRRKLPIRISVAPIYDMNGVKTGYLETIEDIHKVEALDKQQSTAYSFANIIGRSPKMETIFQTLPILSQSDTSILITGETGTGKDLVAEAIHQTSEREAGPFIKINCGALPETLLESEIFGHEKGAFTGAAEAKPGRFKLAHNGTIFLTEIGDLPLPLQVKLLTFLDDQVIYPLGSTKGFNANVRMIAATNRNLGEMVQQGNFRKDLFFRLNVARIHLPPLREREGDIRLLLDHFFNHYQRKLNKTLTGFSKSALAALMTYHYEGNIRELKNIVEYAVSVANTSMIEPENLPAYLFDAVQDADDFSASDGRPAENAAAPGSSKIKFHEHDSQLEGSFPGRNIVHQEKTAQSHLSPAGARMSGVKETWPDIQRRMILDALLKANGKREEAARMLGMGRSTLWRKIKQYGIDPKGMD